jgi:hypothetical protein
MIFDVNPVPNLPPRSVYWNSEAKHGPNDSLGYELLRELVRPEIVA